MGLNLHNHKESKHKKQLEINLRFDPSARGYNAATFRKESPSPLLLHIAR